MTSRPTEEWIAEALAKLAVHQLLRDSDDGKLRAEAAAFAAGLGLSLIDASSNDYLGLATRGVSRATLTGWEGVLAGSGASRLIHGSRPPHLELERELASWVGLPASLLFSSGYAANVGLMTAIGDPDTLIVSDVLNHASIIDGCRLSRSAVRVVPHLDLKAMGAELLRGAQYKRRWVVVESYFSMDGDGPDLPALRSLCDRHSAGLIVDEAHALGVFGSEGAGRCSEAGVLPDALVGTLGKAVGVHGAFVAGSARLRQLLWNRARSFVFSTAPSPLLAKLGLLHVKQCREADGLRARLRRSSESLRERLAQAGVPVVHGSFGPIVPVVLGDNDKVLSAASSLRREGILTQGIRPPTVPPGTARLRVTVTSALAGPELQRLSDALLTVSRAIVPEVTAPVCSPAPSTATRPGPKRVVVLGTGTAVGKTFVAAALARHLRAEHGVLALKPIESGCLGGVAEDAALLASACGRQAPPSPWRYERPVSPHLAAREEAGEVRLEEVRDWVAEAVADDPMLQYVVIETAGGVFSPLSLETTNFDLAQALEPAKWILVASDSLGVLHDVTATLLAMKGRGRTPDALVLSRARAADASTGTNAEELARVGVRMPIVALGSEPSPWLESLAALLP